jgi:anti-sigma B factor antagonist
MNDQTSRIAIRTESNVLTVSGVVDSHTSGQLLERIEASAVVNDLRLDLAAVDFMDSSGLRVIVNAHRELEAAGNRLVLTGASEAVTRLLAITGLTDHLHLR